jgi:hypothetical protein
MGNAYAFGGIYPKPPGRLHDVFFPCGLLNSELTCGATGLALIQTCKKVVQAGRVKNGSIKNGSIG